ncbi:uncharacterized protein LOC115034826 [Acyrthosiphon pisum]|uniref:DUF4806 domain-containing protein n=1 Tax=Acyrthosiphon pisum TaxID=7029 RepID=A0A8R2NTR1_ACYPI|nr:uncharacterized protein LOC115034826 [Acyrthosiphon pisum]
MSLPPVAAVANSSHAGEIRCNLSKKFHSCSFDNIKDVNNVQMMLVAMSHNMCKISADIQKIKSNIIHIKSEIESFILNDSKNVNNKESQTLEKRNEDILSIFPLNTDDELLAIENKLKDEDLSYTQKLISAFIFASEGKTAEKVTTSLLKLIFTLELASEYSWKGQKGKKKLHDHHIFKVIIAAVKNKFPGINKDDIKPNIMTWFAQASHKIKTSKQVKERCNNNDGNCNNNDDNQL